MAEPREKARLAAIISRRRAQIERLENLLHAVRLQLEDDEQRLNQLNSRVGGKMACRDAGRSLRKCRTADAENNSCADAARALAK